MENSNQQKTIRDNQQKTLIRQQKKQEQITKTEVEDHFKNIKNHDLLNLSCSIKKEVDDFVNNLKEKIPICFMTKVVKCDKTNNFFLTVQIFKDLEKQKQLTKKQKQLEEQGNNSNYDAKTIRRDIVSLIKKKYKNKDISIFESEEIHNESIPKCKVYYDCFEVNKEFRNEIIKTWILRAMLAGAVGLGIYTGTIGVFSAIQFFGLTKLMNYNIVSRARTFTNKWWNNRKNWFPSFLKIKNERVNKIIDTLSNYKDSLNDFLDDYISEDFLRKYQDFGTIRVIFNRELQDYADIVNIYYENEKISLENEKEDNKEKIKKEKLDKCIDVINDNVNLMNHQLKYFEKSDVDPKFSESMWKKLLSNIPNVGTLVPNLVGNLSRKIKSFFRGNDAKKKEEEIINEYLKSEPIKLIDGPNANIKLLRIRKDMLTFDIFEYLKVCFKNFNYYIEDIKNVEDNRVQIYVNESETFYSYFKINFDKPLSSPYVYVKSIENNKNVLLTNAATSTTKRLSLQQFKQKYTKPLEELKKQEAQRVRVLQQRRKEAQRLEKQQAQRLEKQQAQRLEKQQAQRLEKQKAQRLEKQKAQRLEKQKAQRLEKQKAQKQEAQRVRKEAEQLKKKQIQTLLKNLDKQSFFQLYEKYPDHQYNKQHSQIIKEFLERQTNKMFKGKVGNQYEMVDKRIRKKIQRQEAQLIQKYRRLVGTQSNQNKQQENLVRRQQQQNSRKISNQQEKQSQKDITTFSDQQIDETLRGKDESSSDESYEYDYDENDYDEDDYDENDYDEDDSDNDEFDSDEIDALYGN